MCKIIEVYILLGCLDLGFDFSFIVYFKLEEIK